MKQAATDDSTEALLEALDPLDDSTSGATTSALASAMLALFSIGRWGLMAEALQLKLTARGDRLSQELSGGARDDSPTSAAERHAHRLPKAGDEYKRAPRPAIQRAVVQAAHVTLANLPAAVGPSRRPGTDLSRQGGG